MLTRDIRERFLRYFEDHGHHRLPSASLLTQDDPSLLFTVAGMVPLKPYITGEVVPPSPNLTSCQKCFRGQGLRDDIAEVGDDTHLTFFEMLGNWSIGDYFKEQAIVHAWNLLTTGYGLHPDRLWATVYPEDGESRRLWSSATGLPAERVVDARDNWWEAGPTGPCGYDSEIHWDMGGPCSCGRTACTPADECGGDRWVEIWNLVFMEFDQDAGGARRPLPRPTVDTGMGLERLAAVVQGVRSPFDTDALRGIIAAFGERSTAAPGPATTRSLHVLADHGRAATFLVADGVLPGTEGRGYVLRRVIRRAVDHGRRIGLVGGLAPAVAAVVAAMGDAYPEIAEHRELIEGVLRTEEEAFARTLDAGMERFAAVVASGAGTVDGAEAFRLHDTYGLPIEMTVELAAERGIGVDRAGFEAAMEEQRARSRSARTRAGFGGGPALPATEFVGYEELACDATVLRIGISADLDLLDAGGEADVVLDRSPFYAEGGGQVGDTGELVWEGGRARVLDTQAAGAARLSTVRVQSGTLHRGQGVRASVDGDRRAQVARHHSATHFLNQALREVLGAGVVQRGSFVGPDHTTFDFSFPRALSDAELSDLEGRVNARIRANLDRRVEHMPLPQARASGAIALLDETYTETVRVVDFGGWSRELCGGTHVSRTGDVGAAIIVDERSIGQGIRRIEMVVGEAAERHWRSTDASLRAAAQALKAPPADVAERVRSLQEQVRLARRQAEEVRRRASTPAGAAAVEEVGPFRLGTLVVEGDAADVVAGADSVFAEQLHGEGVALVLGTDTIAVKVGNAARAAGVRAGSVVGAAETVLGGRGGGRDDFARGSIKDPSRRADAVEVVRNTLREVAA
ncbi:MAG: alanine--tRNA ligase [Candidatus Dormibacteria bacterium]